MRFKKRASHVDEARLVFAIFWKLAFGVHETLIGECLHRSGCADLGRLRLVEGCEEGHGLGQTLFIIFSSFFQI